MGTRQFTKNDCTVFSYDADTSLLNKLGEGTIEGTAQELENNALLDAETDFEAGPNTYIVDAELACESDDVDWFTRLGGSGALSVVTTTETISGTFGVVSARKAFSGAMRWNVRLRNKGTVTIS